ncbi:MAG: GGDEF domain-containing protein [Betaproteobacteria bacterium]|nr:GGDEF domain-containing protein [Betaproteobacteria bacterium]
MDEQTAQAVLALLSGLDSVSAARISREGRLVGARGFLAEILPHADASRCFCVPPWAQLQEGTGGDDRAPLYQGSLTLAGERGVEHVLKGSLWRDGTGVLLVAERPGDDIEHLSKATVRLSNELAAARRELSDARGDLTDRDEKVRVMSFVDGITGLGNQRAFNQALASEVLRAERYGDPLCLVLASIDALEGVAGHFGDDRADDVLRCFARVVCNETRKTDQACRIGANRFMLLLTHTPPQRAAAVTERIRVAFAAASPGMVATTVTASFGHADWKAGDDVASLTERVEKALVAARAAGGDRVEAA